MRHYLESVRNGLVRAGYVVPFDYSDRAVAEWVKALLALGGLGQLPLRTAAGVFAADLVADALTRLLGPDIPFESISGIEKAIITEALKLALKQVQRNEAVPWVIGGAVGAAALAYLISRG